MRVLYAGDSPVGGPANYLLGVLKSLRAEFVHLPPSARLSPRWFRHRYEVIILSDFPRRQLPRDSEKLLVEQVSHGTGFLMVGGWSSFSAPFGKWRDSLVEKILPVHCQPGDDRVNFSSGAILFPKRSHAVLDSVPMNDLPVICGLNRVRPKKDSRILLAARKILVTGRTGPPKSQGCVGATERSWRAGKKPCKLTLDKIEYPVLVVGGDATKKVAAFATDIAPHWCGGLVDWGKKRVRIHIKGDIWIEVGDRYVRLLSSLIRWLSQ